MAAAAISKSQSSQISNSLLSSETIQTIVGIPKTAVSNNEKVSHIAQLIRPTVSTELCLTPKMPHYFYQIENQGHPVQIIPISNIILDILDKSLLGSPTLKNNRPIIDYFPKEVLEIIFDYALSVDLAGKNVSWHHLEQPMENNYQNLLQQERSPFCLAGYSYGPLPQKMLATRCPAIALIPQTDDKPLEVHGSFFSPLDSETIHYTHIPAPPSSLHRQCINARKTGLFKNPPKSSQLT